MADCLRAHGVAKEGGHETHELEWEPRMNTNERRMNQDGRGFCSWLRVVGGGKRFPFLIFGGKGIGRVICKCLMAHGLWLPVTASLWEVMEMDRNYV